MIPLLRLRQSHLGLRRTGALFGPAAAAIRCLSSRASPSSNKVFSSLQALARRASSKQSPPKQSPPKPDPAKPFVAPRLIIYHYGMPRVLFIGALKLTTVFVFGFFVAVVIPSCAQADVPTWQVAGLVVASTIPFLAIWYLTSPMVMWIHVPIPRGFQRQPQRIEQFVQHAPPTTEVAITTMGALGKPRVSRVSIKDLRHETRRFGLVNYVRDVSRENAERKWYQFRAVSEFRIEDEMPPKTKAEKAWLWYTLAKASREQQPKRAPQVQVQARTRERR